VSDATWADGDTISYTINGQTLTATFKTNDANYDDSAAYNVTGTTADVNIANGGTTVNNVAEGIANAMQAMIDANDTLKGDYTATVSGDKVIIEAVSGGEFDGAAGSISNATV